MLIKSVIIVVLLFVVFNLFKGLHALVKGQGNSQEMARILGIRVAASAVLVILLIVGATQGWIQPHGLPQVKPTAQEVVPAP